MISKRNGSIILQEKNIVISPSLKKEEFLASPLFASLREDSYQHKNLHSNYRLSPQTINKENLNIRLYFDPEEKLVMIEMGILVDGVMPSWSDWTLEKELEKKTLHDKWLIDTLGEVPHRRNPDTKAVTFAYHWGSICSGYDPRSASSSIVIRYNHDDLESLKYQ